MLIGPLPLVFVTYGRCVFVILWSILPLWKNRRFQLLLLLIGVTDSSVNECGSLFDQSPRGDLAVFYISLVRKSVQECRLKMEKRQSFTELSRTFCCDERSSGRLCSVQSPGTCLS